MKLFIILFFSFYAAATLAAPSDICDILNLPNCRGVTRQLRRNTFQTAPTTTTAANLNPANVSFDKGLGFEVLGQAKNPLLFGLTSGTGKMGGALISGSRDNSFFGNRVPELNEAFIERYENDHQYKNQKLSLALGGKLTATKNFGMDVGLIFKRHSELKDINPGIGMSGRIWKIHFGASFFRDDVFIDLTKYSNPSTGTPYSVEFGKDSLDENFLVTTYTLGTRIRNFAVDVGTIRSTIKDLYDDKPTTITIYSGSYYYKDFLFNIAYRKEHSLAPVYEDKQLRLEEDKSQMYYGLQYSLNKHIIFGLNYNYFLLKEVSGTITLFI